MIELNVGISELESLIGVARLAIGGAEEVTCSGTFDDGLRQHASILQAREVKVSQGIPQESEAFVADLLAFQ